MKNMEQEIREDWFKNHKASLTNMGELQVLDWREPGTSIYSCRYVFDGNKMYISGDIGTAVFDLTWKGNVHSFNDVGIQYFEEKMAAFSDPRRDFSTEKALNRLKEWRQQLDDDGVIYDAQTMAALISEAHGCSSHEEWAIDCVNGQYSEFISKLNPDYWEWMYAIGDEIPARVYAYLMGLQMASVQLREGQPSEKVNGDDDAFVTVRWGDGDLFEAFHNTDVDPTPENIQRFKESHAPQTLKDRLIGDVSEILNDLIDSLVFDRVLTRKECGKEEEGNA